MDVNDPYNIMREQGYSEIEIAAADIRSAIDAALAAADKQAISGKDLTPFLLQHMVALTGGDSLKTNIALVLNNARLAAKIAVAMTAA